MSLAKTTDGAIVSREIVSYSPAGAVKRSDLLAVEEPLEIQVSAKTGDIWQAHSIAVTMRTPGDDLALAVGFLLSEQVIKDSSWVHKAAHLHDDQGTRLCNLVRITLTEGVDFDPTRFSRQTFTSSSCGICGRQTIERVRATQVRKPQQLTPLTRKLLPLLMQQLEQQQEVFQSTGGLHASALFSADGQLLMLREDVGRHNALDKVIGQSLLAGTLPADDTILLLSGRASFELIQKAAIAGIGKVVAIGPPSSLAVDLAEEFGMTLVGFLRSDRFNVYTGTVPMRG